MPGDLARILRSLKKRFYGKTFRCPVCHLELSFDDLDEHHLMVCPLCGVVLDVDDPYGHPVPVVVDVELFRPQPKARLHPLATHLPIGLYPFALAGAVLLLLVSVLAALGWAAQIPWLAARAPVVADATLVLLVVSVGWAPLTVAAGLWDWWHRYRRRPYRVITLKILFSVVFLILGGAALALHASGLVYGAATGLVDLSSPLHVGLALLDLLLLGGGMIAVATLGHVGGNLVFGR